MKIGYTKHAEKKFKDLAALGVIINTRFVNGIVRRPVHLDEVTDPPNKIASGKLDTKRILRVVYREKGDRIVVVTFFPARKGRYF